MLVLSVKYLYLLLIFNQVLGHFLIDCMLLFLCWHISRHHGGETLRVSPQSLPSGVYVVQFSAPWGGQDPGLISNPWNHVTVMCCICVCAHDHPIMYNTMAPYLLGSLSEKNKRRINWILSKVERMISRTCLADGSFKLDLFLIKYVFNIK